MAVLMLFTEVLALPIVRMLDCAAVDVAAPYWTALGIISSECLSPEFPWWDGPSGTGRKAETFQMASANDQVSISLSEENTNDLPGMTSSDMKTVPKEAVLSFRIISYRVKEKIGFLHGWKTVETEVLSNINGIMKPGLNAIMGPPGGGKSLLLDVLAARKDPHGLSGDVLLNGAPRPANFKCISGYVEQDDVVMDNLTVRENLQFSAALRLPTTMRNDEKNERINTIIKELGLDAVADFK
uniref:ATP-binding cassette sub-family G member 2-like n=1 Tax=Castor canadensis TaxID=51338 RepID=A0A8B7VJP3_CASCN